MHDVRFPLATLPVPCLLAALALATPRLVILALWIATTWFRGLFDFALWPILGFLLAPTTLLWYAAVQHWYDGRWGTWQFVGLLVALVLDGVPAKLGLGDRK